MANPLTRIKSVEQSMADTDEPEHKLRKNLSAWNLIVFGVSVVIGAGIFTLTVQTAADKAGPAISVSFIIAAITCAFAALCYAEFASTVPVAGSAYTFGYATLGEFVAWILGWDLILEFAVGAAVVAKGWSQYVVNAFTTNSTASSASFDIGSVTVDWGAILIIAVVTTLLVIGTRLSSVVSAVITAIKVGVVLLVIVVGFFHIKADNFTPFVPPAESGEGTHKSVDSTLFSLISGGGDSSYGWYGVLAAASLVFFAFIGFDVVATTAEETRNPRKDVPRGILGSLAIVTALYVLVTIVVTGMVSYKELAGKDADLADVFQVEGITWAEKVTAFGALAGLTTVVMVLMLGQSRVLFAMCRDGLLPRAMSKTHPRFGTPARLTILIGVVCALVAGFLPIDKLHEMVNVGTLFAFIVVAIGVMVLRRTRPDLERGFRVPGGPVIPVLAVIACIWLMLNLSALTWIRFLVWMVLGVAVYFLYSQRHSMVGKRERGEVPPLDDAKVAPEGRAEL
ncbi:amino acid permease [Gordonia sp. ABSL49_1]|uniref:amino acid permease n=1 Tax=unclassified Gordonia (in: high G+C Gram-positive bacteria) TaxID=2657482 RepID=UPI001F0D8A06|nr:amino acid permease [Gordonia sp. ABSL49_1]MCH5642233.1 amino acid permease [Gordonia sp. ABSL49_1]